MEELGYLGEKYIIKKIISEDGVSSIVLLVEDKEKHMQYAAKVNVEEKFKKFILDEAEFLTLLKNKSPYIIDYIEKKENSLLSLEGNNYENKNYIILEYCLNGILYDYIILINQGFGETFSKLIFQKILKGVQAIHKEEIVHLDLKSDNILLDKDYNLKICDFGFSLKKEEGINLTKIRIMTGTPEYKSPQIVNRKKYNGFKNDIYSLGITLFSLVTGKLPFLKYEEYTEARKDFDKFFKSTEDNTNNLTLSPEFKNLFKKMISLKEKDRPENIGKILEDDWFKDIDKLSNKEKEDLENKLIEEFKSREDKINKMKILDMDANEEEDDKCHDDNRGFEEDIKDYFSEYSLLSTIKDEKYLDNYIRIKGKIIPYKFMNSLASILNKKLYDIKVINNNLEFDATYEEEEEDNEEEEKEMDKEIEEEEGISDKEDNIEEEENSFYENKCDVTIRITLNKNSNEELLLSFLKTSGGWNEYYMLFKKIVLIVKKILKMN